MDTYRVGIRNQKGEKVMLEVSGIQSHAFARDFVTRETKAPVVLALVNPIEPKAPMEPQTVPEAA